jgi:hypothetical protein
MRPRPALREHSDRSETGSDHEVERVGGAHSGAQALLLLVDHRGADAEIQSDLQEGDDRQAGGYDTEVFREQYPGQTERDQEDDQSAAAEGQRGPEQAGSGADCQ